MTGRFDPSTMAGKRGTHPVQAAQSVRAYLERHAMMRGIDPEVIHTIGDRQNGVLPLRVSDLVALVEYVEAGPR